MSARVYVEGGGDSKEMHARCREGFRRLLERAGFAGRMPRLVACGSRGATFGDFRTAHGGAQAGFVAMLVDSEAPVDDAERPWAHLQARDGWATPDGASEEQALLMITCMEGWVASDRSALRERFGPALDEKALPAAESLETRSPAEILQALERATRNCPAGYTKGRVSFEVVGLLDPDVVRVVPSFARMVRVLDQRLI